MMKKRALSITDLVVGICIILFSIIALLVGYVVIGVLLLSIGILLVYLGYLVRHERTRKVFGIVNFIIGFGLLFLMSGLVYRIFSDPYPDMFVQEYYL